ncbi:MAG: ribosome recycling factor [Chlamydiae bacterium CG10_big_fil_rev_8_21_14_0_10_35_9]|nr:MAG: ribosome recycling factor [Chlamydiae bacterium CG10_big_fil_rev_8_21_14_0_10_35_9]
MTIEKETKSSMEGAVAHLQSELKNLRTSRANPSILDSVSVEVYGAKMRLRDVANITVPEPRQILITPYDSNNTGVIGKAIENANLNLQPIVEGNVVRINIPPMDAKMRESIAKQCKRKGEDAKVVVREVRRKNNELIRKQKADGEIPEDLMKSLEKKIQELTDSYCKQIDEICEKKQEEILEI